MMRGAYVFFWLALPSAAFAAEGATPPSDRTVRLSHPAAGCPTEIGLRRVAEVLVRNGAMVAEDRMRIEGCRTFSDLKAEIVDTSEDGAAVCLRAFDSRGCFWFGVTAVERVQQFGPR